MQKIERPKTAELVIFIGLWALYRLNLVLSKPNPHIHWHEVGSTLNYAIASGIIVFIAIPVYFEREKYWSFLVSSLAIIMFFSGLQEYVFPLVTELDNEEPDFRWRLSSMLTGSVFFIMFKLAWISRKRKEQLMALEKERVDSQLQYLRSQIHPHFLFNSLNNIYSKALEQKKETPRFILVLSDLLRYMLYDANTEKVRLKNELDQLERYILLQKDQMEGNTEVEYVMKGDPSGLVIAPLLLFPFVENSFKHGFGVHIEDPLISVKVEINKDRLIFESSNPYNLISETNTINSPSGIGLENVKKRLELIYPNCYDLSIERRNGQFIVNLQLDLLCQN